MILLMINRLEGFAPDASTGLNRIQTDIYSSKNGLPNNTIQALSQTRTGYIWCGTPAGLVRFDGSRFKTFNSINIPALNNNNITTLYEDNNGMLWIGTDRGDLFSAENGQWKQHFYLKTPVNSPITSILQDWTGQLWIGTHFGLYCMKKDEIIHYTTEDGFYSNIITDLELDYLGNLWIAFLQGGIAVYKEGRFQVFGYDEGLSNLSVLALKADHQGLIWIGTMEGLYQYNKSENLIFRIPGIYYTPVTSIIEDQWHALWIGTMADGIKRLYNDRLVSLNSDSGFPDDYIRCLLTDMNGNLWIGTDTRGMIRLQEMKIQNITRYNGLPENMVSTVLVNREGTLWASGRSKGLYKIMNHRIEQTWPDATYLSGKQVRALLTDPEGDLWIGTNEGLIKIRHNRIITYPFSSKKISCMINCLFMKSPEELWIGSTTGLWGFNKKDQQFQSIDSKLQNSNIQQIETAKDGAFFLGTKEGLYKYSSQGIQSIHLSVNNRQDISCLYKDKSGTLWIGTNGNGIFKHPSSGKNATVQNGLPDNFIYSITEDHFGNYWMSSSTGIFRINRKGLVRYFDRDASYIQAYHLDQSMGLSGGVCSHEGYPNVAKSLSGVLYYPTNMGIAVIQPQDFKNPADPPLVAIEEVKVNGNPVSVDTAGGIYTNDHILIRVTAFNYSYPGKIKFRYKLKGRDEKWVYTPKGFERLISFTRLQPGHYQLVLQAACQDSDWSQHPAIFSFIVNTPFYRNTYFYLWVFLIFTGISGLLFFRKKRIKENKIQIKYKTLPVDPGRADEIFEKLKILMEQEKIYLNANVTLQNIAKKLRVHSNILSRIINEKSSLSYNDFINQYRINLAKHQLVSQGENHKTILEIMYDCGFNSKSVFNTTFKKLTGLTPSQFRQNKKSS